MNKHTLGPCLAVWCRVLASLWSYISQDVACIPDLPQPTSRQKGIWFYLLHKNWTHAIDSLTFGVDSKDMAPVMCCGWDLLCEHAADLAQNYCSGHYNPRAGI